MSDANMNTPEDHVLAHNVSGSSSVVLVCEHASNFIPAAFDNLGLSSVDLKSHAAWDPGAMAVATHLAKCLDAPLVASPVSRLVYDCNRPPNAPDAMPARSEVIDVPGNRNLSQPQRDARAVAFYLPFHASLGHVINGVKGPVVVTVHSFTPLFHGKARTVEIGILHDVDARLADAMLQTAAAHTSLVVRRNEPYGPEHGVTHTLKEHAIKDGHLNVMIEIRNDLIRTAAQQQAMAVTLSGWITDACTQLGAAGHVQCQA